MFRAIGIKARQPNETKTLIIDRFYGVDFTRGDYISDIHRSPDAKNIVWSSNPYVFDTRKGIKRVYSKQVTEDATAGTTPSSATIRGMHVCETTNELFIHAGKRLFKLLDTTGHNVKSQSELMNACMLSESLLTFENESKTKSFMFRDKLYVIGGGRYVVYDGAEWKDVSDNAYVPQVLTGRYPSGGGQVLEGVNLLGAKRIYGFMTDGRSYSYSYTADGNATLTLPATYTSECKNFTVTVNTEPCTVSIENGAVRFSAVPSEGTQITVSFVKYGERRYVLDVGLDETAPTVRKLENGSWVIVPATDYIYFKGTESADGYIEFNEGKQPLIPYTLANDEDNVMVEFSKTNENYLSMIENCSIFGIYGGENDTRVFLSGNDDFPNKDFCSGLYDASYFPDTGYTNIGNSSTKILGYVNQYDTQMIIKESSQQESSAYLRVASFDTNDNIRFTIEQGAVGIGACNSDCFAYLNAEPLFLSRNGVMGITGTNVDNQRLIQDRSSLVNTKLLKEDLSRAVGIEFENRYHLFVGDHVYVADARMRYADALGNTQYEWNYWEIPIPGRVSACVEYCGMLLIGASGMVWRFATSEVDAYLDESVLGAKEGITAYWQTPKLYLGSIAVSKKLRGCHFAFVHKDDLNCKVSMQTQDRRVYDLGTYKEERLFSGWDSFDFETVTFNFPTDLEDEVITQRISLNRMDSASLKFTNNPIDKNGKTVSTNFGVALIQITYSYNDIKE